MRPPDRNYERLSEEQTGASSNERLTVKTVEVLYLHKSSMSRQIRLRFDNHQRTTRRNSSRRTAPTERLKAYDRVAVQPVSILQPLLWLLFAYASQIVT